MLLLKTGVYVIEFKDIETRTEVMTAGPWSFDTRPMIPKSWTVKANLENEDMVEVPIWVRFPNMKLHLWSTHLLSKIFSIIGKPSLFTDKMTINREIITFTRVCVKVRVGVSLPEVIAIY